MMTIKNNEVLYRYQTLKTCKAIFLLLHFQRHTNIHSLTSRTNLSLQ